MQKLNIGQFVIVSDGRLGIITSTDRNGGVFRGHVDIWFGALDPTFHDSYPDPTIEQLLVKDDWQVAATPLGITESERKTEKVIATHVFRNKPCPGCDDPYYIDGCLNCGYGIDGFFGKSPNFLGKYI